jgi:superfamily I DNA and/or RNA helicase
MAISLVKGMVEKRKFVKEYLSALDLEYQEEIKDKREKLAKLSTKQCKDLGLLFSFSIDACFSGVSGRVCYDLSSPQEIRYSLKVGDVLQIFSKENSNSLSGVITVAKGKNFVLAFKECLPVNICEVVLFAKVANDITFERMRKALHRLEKTEITTTELCFPADKSNNERILHKLDFEPLDSSLNESQKEAVKAALADNNPLVMIHGPPGTGKTQTLLEVIKQLINRGKKLLVCGPSNLSVDNIVERLNLKFGLVLRLGHPARITEKAQRYSFENLLAERSDYEVIKDVKRQLDALIRTISTRKATRDEYHQMRELRRELKDREMRASEQFITSIKVVCCTLTSADDRLVREIDFDVVIVDEASQALEAETWIATLKGRRIVLAGDHLQLPPTIMCKDAEKTLYLSLFERMQKLYPPLSCLLNIQYRMHRDIMAWSNSYFYNNKLIADDSVADKRIEGIAPLVLIDTAGFEMFEEAVEDERESKSNRHEVTIALKHADMLYKTGITDIAIITPYSAQMLLLIDTLNESFKDLANGANLEIGTVDSFQGRERDAVIFSFVRSNDFVNSSASGIGFLSELRRTNVAITRARRHACLIMDSDTIGRGHEAYKKLVEYIEKLGTVEYPS